MGRYMFTMGEIVKGFGICYVCWWDLWKILMAVTMITWEDKRASSLRGDFEWKVLLVGWWVGDYFKPEVKDLKKESTNNKGEKEIDGTVAKKLDI